MEEKKGEIPKIAVCEIQKWKMEIFQQQEIFKDAKQCLKL